MLTQRSRISEKKSWHFEKYCIRNVGDRKFSVEEHYSSPWKVERISTRETLFIIYPVFNIRRFYRGRKIDDQ